MMPERDFGYYYEDETFAGDDPQGESSRTEEGKADDVQDEKEKPRIRKRDTQARTGSVMTIIFFSVLAAIMLGSVIYSLNRSNTAFNRVAKKNQELNAIEAENVRLQSELESRVSAKNIEDYAENTLHMRKIDSSQIKYIRIQQDDVVNIPEQDEGVKAKIKNFFDDLVEYFRG